MYISLFRMLGFILIIIGILLLPLFGLGVIPVIVGVLSIIAGNQGEAIWLRKREIKRHEELFYKEHPELRPPSKLRQWGRAYKQLKTKTLKDHPVKESGGEGLIEGDIGAKPNGEPHISVDEFLFCDVCNMSIPTTMDYSKMNGKIICSDCLARGMKSI